MIQPETWKKIYDDAKAAWAIVGPLVYALAGVLVGAYISNRNQREHWIADNKRSEYRELITALAKSFTSILKLRAFGVALGPEEQRMLSNLETDASAVILDRLLIADEIFKMNVLKRWNQATREYDQTLDHDAFAITFGRIRMDLKNSATSMMKGTMWYDRWLKKLPFSVGKFPKTGD